MKPFGLVQKVSKSNEIDRSDEFEEIIVLPLFGRNIQVRSVTFLISSINQFLICVCNWYLKVSIHDRIILSLDWRPALGREYLARRFWSLQRMAKETIWESRGEGIIVIWFSLFFITVKCIFIDTFLMFWRFLIFQNFTLHQKERKSVVVLQIELWEVFLSQQCNVIDYYYYYMAKI